MATLVISESGCFYNPSSSTCSFLPSPIVPSSFLLRKNRTRLKIAAFLPSSDEEPFLIRLLPEEIEESS